MTEKTIKLKKDIIQEVVEELGISEKVVKTVVNSAIDYFHTKCETDKNILTIGFRNLCTFHSNFRMMTFKRKTSRITNYRYSFLDEIKATTKHVEIPLCYVLYRNHIFSKKVKQETNEEVKHYLPRISECYQKYYAWFRQVEDENNKKVERYFK